VISSGLNDDESADDLTKISSAGMDSEDLYLKDDFNRAALKPRISVE
jgi:hypothetical protein